MHNNSPIKFGISADGTFSVFLSDSDAIVAKLEIEEIRGMAYALLGAAVLLEASAAKTMARFDVIVAESKNAKQGTA